MANQSAVLARALAADPDRARDVTFCGAAFPGIDTMLDVAALHPHARIESPFMTPAARRAMAEGRASVLALDYLGYARHLLESPPPDVVVAQLSPPDADGWCAPGLGVDFLPLVWARAKRRVAHLNPRLPRLASSFRVHIDELDARVEEDAPLHVHREPRAGEIEQRIAGHVAALVRDGDTLQLGIGSVPAALVGALCSHRGLRLLGGMTGESLRTLWQAGALDRDARIVTGMVLGDESLHAFLPEVPHLWLTDVRQTHEPAAVAAAVAVAAEQGGSRFVAINGAVEVDLFGQVNSERAGGSIQAGAGGLPAYAMAARLSPGGRLLICLPACARQGTVSRIVPALGEQALVTVPRHLADAVVTEHGVAELRGLSLDARAQALIGIAAPAHRAALEQAWVATRQRL